MTSRQTEQDSADRVFALLSDGGQVEIRRLAESDAEAVRILPAGLSDESHYRRFFALDRSMAGRLAERVCASRAPVSCPNASLWRSSPSRRPSSSTRPSSAAAGAPARWSSSARG
ncbi:hypothetical protein [Actinomadura sediminis]|uniref:GNAT family N-acetyltransferase n=1 Tax=Actinomadura sediminis TaxID=1038904 RepID=A0ABW3EHL3_9ACTN